MTGRLETELDGLPVTIVATGETLQVSPSVKLIGKIRSLGGVVIASVEFLRRVNIDTEIILLNRYHFRLTPSRIKLLRKFVA